MAYDVNYHIDKKTFEITTDYSPYEPEKESSIMLRQEDFCDLIKRYSDEVLLKEAWQVLKIKLDENEKEIMEELENSIYYNMIDFNDE